MILGKLSPEDQNPAALCPCGVFERQVMVPVRFYTFSRRKSAGIIAVDMGVADEIAELFDIIFAHRFPITSAIPIAYPPFKWDDERSMAANNTSGFNYRTIAGTDHLSWHAIGRAIDINPWFNPLEKDGVVRPEGAERYDPSQRGAIAPDSVIVRFMKAHGWQWGGDWRDYKDYQHFQKPLH